MAHVMVLEGPEDLLGKKILLGDDREENEHVFEQLTENFCFWRLDLSGLSKQAAYETKIIDFSCRCARSICRSIPVFIDGKKIKAYSINKKSVDRALEMLINLLKVSYGHMKIVKDDEKELRIETVLGQDALKFMMSSEGGNS